MDLLKKLKAGASKAADVAQQTVEVTKLHAQILSKRKEAEKNIMQIGNEVYAAFKSGDASAAEEKVQELAQSVMATERDIASLEQQIKLIKNEKTCECGKTVSLDSKFCPDCGRTVAG